MGPSTRARFQTRQMSTSQSPFTAQQADAAATAPNAAAHPMPWEDQALLGKNTTKMTPLPKSGTHTGPNQMTGEIGGPSGPEPTRYGDFEKAGRCYDF